MTMELPDDLKQQMDAAFAELRAKYPGVSVSVQAERTYYAHADHDEVNYFVCVHTAGIIGKTRRSLSDAIVAVGEAIAEKKLTRKKDLLAELAAIEAEGKKP